MAEESLMPKQAPSKLKYASEGLGVFFKAAVAIFLAVSIITGGLYLWRFFSQSSLNQQKSALDKLKVAFEPTLITDLEHLSKSINSAREILRKHAHSSRIFDLLEANVLPQISFNSFAYSADKNTISLSGEASSYADVAAQSAVFESLTNVDSATFSGLSLKESAGTVSFNLNVVLKP